MDPTIESRAAGIKLLLMDCDGVMTDGHLWVLEHDGDQKAFSARDGLGLDLLHRGGIKSGVISGRRSGALERRAKGLGMSYLKMGFEDKVQVFAEVLAEAGLEGNQVAYVGDDLNDIPLLKQAGLAVAVADAVSDTKAHAHYVTSVKGGNGAVREVCELILKSQGLWSGLINKYL
jgi:3-deoxy-D-manno-octulosonate 8-phosphate phosphatase (KDO 8-P phosphatase)